MPTLLKMKLDMDIAGATANAMQRMRLAHKAAGHAPVQLGEKQAQAPGAKVMPPILTKLQQLMKDPVAAPAIGGGALTGLLSAGASVVDPNPGTSRAESVRGNAPMAAVGGAGGSLLGRLVGQALAQRMGASQDTGATVGAGLGLGLGGLAGHRFGRFMNKRAPPEQQTPQYHPPRGW